MAFIEGESDEESNVSDLSFDDEHMTPDDIRRFKLAMKIESKIEKLERHLNRVATKDERDRFVKLYLTKDDNFMVIISLI